MALEVVVMKKAEKYLASAMVPMAVGVAALCYLAWRPCEPVAHAAEEPTVVQVAPITIVADDGIPVVSVEDLPKAAPTQGSRKGMAGVSRKSAMVCTDQSPEWHCHTRQLQMGTYGDTVQDCDCGK